MNKLERIQKLISNYGKFSRREVEKLIIEGRVKINNNLASLGDKATIDDVIKIDDQVQKFNLKHLYFIVNKPLGYISSKKDEFNKEVISLVPNPSNRNIYNVGRLDVNTSGLIILTTDGRLADLIMRPENKVKKTYLCWINNPLTKEHILKLSKGIKINNGYVTLPAKIKIISNEPSNVCLKISIFEGKNNQIRQMVEALDEGYKVINLKREKINNLNLSNIPLGGFKKISQTELLSKLNIYL